MQFPMGSRNSVNMMGGMLRLAPKPRIIAGLVLMVGGVGLSALLWDRGVIWGLPLFAGFFGMILFFTGLSGLTKQKARELLLSSVNERKEALIEGMLTEKREGRNPVRWLNDQGILDGEIRGLLIDAMNERLRQPRGK